jgi:hypothetical protein
MGASKLTIWNLALSRLGAGKVNLETERSTKALQLSSTWDANRREVFESAPFECSTVIETLSTQSGFTIPPGWSYVYIYPPKALNVWLIYPSYAIGNQYNSDYDSNALQEYKKKHEFRKILSKTTNTHVLVTNVASAWCEYSYDLEDTTLYDDAVVSALAYRLAADAAMPLTGDPDMATAMMNAYANAISEAKRVTKAENNVGTLGQNSIIDSRG